LFLKCHPGISDTVVLGSISNDRDRVSVFDVTMIERRSQRGRPWRERLDILGAVWSRLPVEVSQVYPLARTWSTGLLGAFDAVKRSGGAGLVVRVFGENKSLVCSEV